MPIKGELVEYVVDHVFFQDLELLCDSCNSVIDTDAVVFVSERSPNRVYHAKCVLNNTFKKKKRGGRSINLIHFECSAIPEICQLIQKTHSLEGKSKLPPLTFDYLARKLNIYAGYTSETKENTTSLDDFGANYDQ